MLGSSIGLAKTEKGSRGRNESSACQKPSVVICHFHGVLGLVTVPGGMGKNVKTRDLAMTTSLVISH